MRVVNQQVPTPFRDVDLGQLLRPNVLEFVRKGALLPFRAIGVARQMAGQLGQMSAMDVVLGLAEGLPSGLYSGSGIEEYVRAVLSDPDRTDDFRMLENELYLAATDLDTCERIVFGANDWDDVPISTAVRASTALPMVYKPVRVRDRELVDGGIVSTTNLDIAVEAGAKFVVVVNPLVPYVNDFTQKTNTLLGARVRHVSRHGLPADRLPGVQAPRLPAAARDGQAVGGALPRRRHPAHRARAQRRADVPDVDHELHEPRGHRPPRLPVGDAQARRGLRATSATPASATASRSPPRACARSSSTSPPRRRRPAPGARSSSRRPARCCASRRTSSAAWRSRPARWHCGARAPRGVT